MKKAKLAVIRRAVARIVAAGTLEGNRVDRMPRCDGGAR